MVAPGSPLDFRCKGSNKLLKEGATLVDSAEDILNALQMMTHSTVYQNTLFNGYYEKAHDVKRNMIKQLSHSPSNVDEIIGDSTFTLNKSFAALAELEMEEKIERSIDNTIMLKC